ncbi:MAG: zinc-binding alcohol dehydrogenase [Ruminococcaceae bacterium]|nr:zinc-binding alcohol dehydrogenase [Oscillospiraceae bacterium]
MKNKNIIFTAPCVAELLEKEMPTPGAGEVLVRSVRDTISSGTERANLIGDPNVHGRSAPVVDFPRQVGYSISGVVEAVGEGVTSVSVGDAVACSWTKHAQYNVLTESRVYPLGEVGFDAGALVHIATFPLAAIRKCRLELGEPAIVMGLGVLGLIAVQLLHAAGAVPIIAVDPIESRRKKALELGADYALNPFDEDFVKTAKMLTGGGAKVAIEVTGKGQGLDMVLDCMKKFGRIALLGCTRDSDFTIDYYRKVHCPGITMIGAHTMARPKVESAEGWWSEKDDATAILELIRHNRLDLACLVNEVHSPNDAPAVFSRLANDKDFPIVQFDWERA